MRHWPSEDTSMKRSEDAPRGPRTTARVTIGGSAMGKLNGLACPPATGDFLNTAWGDYDWWKADFVAGKSYRIEVRGKSTGEGTAENFRISGIFDPGVTYPGVSYASGHDDFTNRGSILRVMFTAMNTGTHHIEVSSLGRYYYDPDSNRDKCAEDDVHLALGAPEGDRGTYKIEVTELTSLPSEAASATALTLGTPHEGALRRGHRVRDWYRATLKAGKNYGVIMTQIDRDDALLRWPTIYGVYNPSGDALPRTRSIGGSPHPGLIPVIILYDDGGNDVATDTGTSAQFTYAVQTGVMSVTGLYPYGHYAVSDRLSVWGVVGYGKGSLTLTPEGQAPMETGMDLTLAGAGLRSVMVAAPAEGGLELAANPDGFVVRTSSDRVQGLAGADAEVTRLRLGLEGTWRGGPFVPSVEIGVRHDGGDAETGFGADIGAGLAWSDLASGIAAEVRGRGLLTHADGDFRERGFAGSLNRDPAPSSARGPTLTLSQTLGAQASGGLDSLLSRPAMAGLAANDDEDALQSRRFDARLGYGFPLLGDRLIGTPEPELRLRGALRW